MFKICYKERLNHAVTMLRVFAPYIAKKAQPGQFVILRVHEEGERIPLTIADYDSESGLITLIFQVVGRTTKELNVLKVGDFILDLAGPLGKPSHLDEIKEAIVIGGGVGCAIALPIAKSLYEKGAKVHSIIGFRNKEFAILEKEFSECSHKLTIMTDDGSYGSKGFVTETLINELEHIKKYDCVHAIGPLPMMKVVSEITNPYEIKTIVSMNPIMIDGTGMCGGCRITVGEEIKFACVDGPDFDGHLVDFDETIARLKFYHKDEIKKLKEGKREEHCNLFKEVITYA